MNLLYQYAASCSLPFKNHVYVASNAILYIKHIHNINTCIKDSALYCVLISAETIDFCVGEIFKIFACSAVFRSTALFAIHRVNSLLYLHQVILRTFIGLDVSFM